MTADGITKEIAALRQMKVPELVERYCELHGKEPHVRHREWLWKRIAWKAQEKRYGGLFGVAKRRLEELIAEIELPTEDQQRTVTGKLGKSRKPGEPKLGTTLTRTWRGRELVVQVREDGYEHDGTLYRTLSAAAKAITGTHLSGRAFFGLTQRKEAAR